LLGLLCGLVWVAPLPAGEDDVQQKWESPNGQFVMRHGLASDFGITATPPEAEQAAAYVLTGKDTKLWTGVSAVDESAHSFRCLWSSDSHFALVLDRPDRGTVRLFLVGTADPVHGGELDLEKLVEERMARAGDAALNSHTLQKAWFGEWRYESGKFKGVLMVAKDHYHRIVLMIDPAQDKPQVRLLSETPAEQWYDALGKL
jgi:hypothetical protein